MVASHGGHYFDRVPKQMILDALTDVGGTELSSRFASLKKVDLAASAERVFAGTYITEAEVRERALAWVPEVMRFAAAAATQTEEAASRDDDAQGAATGGTSDDHAAIHYTSWDDKDGVKRYGCEIIADQVDFLSKGRATDNEGAPPIDED